MYLLSDIFMSNYLKMVKKVTHSLLCVNRTCLPRSYLLLSFSFPPSFADFRIPRLTIGWVLRDFDYKESLRRRIWQVSQIIFNFPIARDLKDSESLQEFSESEREGKEDSNSGSTRVDVYIVYNCYTLYAYVSVSWYYSRMSGFVVCVWVFY